MIAEPLVSSLNALYLSLMGVISLVGTATLYKFITAIFEGRPRRPQRPSYDVEDA